MARELIQLGTAPTGDDGDTVRQAFTKVNANADELYAASDAAATKLATIATGATANATDAQLRDRATHTGTQAISTVSGLQVALDGKQPSNANLTAFAGLTGAADRLPYFTGAGALSLTTLTGLARNLLDDTTQAEMQSTLGLGTASTRTALGTTGALYSRDSILGTVSQSGGVPTGAIIERGSNANGGYVRYADGTQICTGAVTVSGTSWAAMVGGGSYSPVASATFPATFTGTPKCTFTGRDSDVIGRSGYVSFFEASTSGIPAIYMASHVAPVASADIFADIIAVGRWY